MGCAPAEAEKKAKEAAEEDKKKADESSTKEKGDKEDKAQYQRGVEMLDAAVAMEEHVQGPEFGERLRALRMEGCAACLLAEGCRLLNKHSCFNASALDHDTAEQSLCT